jgi:hypothetical protein
MCCQGRRKMKCGWEQRWFLMWCMTPVDFSSPSRSTDNQRYETHILREIMRTCWSFEEEEELYYYCLDTIYFLQYLVTIIHLQLCSKIACIWIIVF